MTTSFSKFFSDNPWGNGSNGNGNDNNGKKPRNPKNMTPENLLDFEDLLKKYKNNFSGGKKNNNNGAKQFLIGILAVIILYLSTGFYTIQPEEEGIILRFGKFDRVTTPGLHYHLPSPLEKLKKVKVTEINSIEVGYRSIGGGRTSSRNEESVMLTGDENIIDVNFEVQWKIKDAYNFLFKIRDFAPGATVKSAAESAMREVIGKSDLAYILSDGRLQVEQETKKLLQEIIDSYESGIEISRLQLLKADPPPQVIDSFRDVQTAKADKEKSINQAESYSNEIIPKARGESQSIIESALAYKKSVVADAVGKASRFDQIFKEYSNAKEITKKRLFLQTMEDIFKSTNVTIIDNQVSKTGMVPYLPIQNNKK